MNEGLNDDGTFRENTWYQHFGESYIPEAYKLAHSIDPNVKLYINDFNIEGVNAKSNAMYNLVKNWRAEGVPIHGVGFQGHYIVGQVPSDVQANLQR